MSAEFTPRQHLADFCRRMAASERDVGDHGLAAQYEALAVEVSDPPCVGHIDVELANGVMCTRCSRTKPTP